MGEAPIEAASVQKAPASVNFSGEGGGGAAGARAPVTPPLACSLAEENRLLRRELEAMLELTMRRARETFARGNGNLVLLICARWVCGPQGRARGKCPGIALRGWHYCSRPAPEVAGE